MQAVTTSQVPKPPPAAPESRAGPRSVSSRRRIVYRPSLWRVHSFSVWSGECVCRVTALRMQDSLLLWVGAGAGAAVLSEVALALPARGQGQGGEVLCSALLGEGGTAVALARRLAAALRRPVLVCAGAAFDRFTAPLVERGLVAEIKSRPDCF